VRAEAWAEKQPKTAYREKIIQRDLTGRGGPITLASDFNRTCPVQQRSLIAELSTVAGLAATRFGMIIGGTTGTTTMPLRAGRV
jgi:hypothetical protein